MLGAQRCRLLTVNGFLLGYATEEEKPPSCFQSLGGGRACNANGILVSRPFEIFMHVNEEN